MNNTWAYSRICRRTDRQSNLQTYRNTVSPPPTPQVQHKLAELKTSLAVCRAFVDQCLVLHDSGRLDSEMASMAK